MASIPKNLSFWRYELGSLVLGILSIFCSYKVGRLRGYEETDLLAEIIAPILITPIVVGIAYATIKSARKRRSAAKIAFFTFLIIVCAKFADLARESVPLPPISTELDQQSLAIDEAQAKAFALQVQDSVTNGKEKEIASLYDGDYFLKKALRGQDTTSRYWRSLAERGSVSFTQMKLFEQMAAMVKQDGEFTFVKLYRIGQEPILQFRLLEASGNLHYIDAYIVKDRQGSIRIDDLRYYNTGESLSKQLVETASQLTSKSDSHATYKETAQQAIQLMQDGKIQEAFTVLESLPDDIKQHRLIMRLRIQLEYQLGNEQAENLLNEFKSNYPNDPSIVFTAFTAAIVKDDVEGAASLIDDIYKAVDGDEFLLWYKANLFIARDQYREATSVLSEMENKYKIDVVSLAEGELPKEFLSSKTYRVWLSRHKKMK